MCVHYLQYPSASSASYKIWTKAKELGKAVLKCDSHLNASSNWQSRWKLPQNSAHLSILYVSDRQEFLSHLLAYHCHLKIFSNYAETESRLMEINSFLHTGSHYLVHIFHRWHLNEGLKMVNKKNSKNIESKHNNVMELRNHKKKPFITVTLIKE